jgi:hypothetical protein
MTAKSLALLAMLAALPAAAQTDPRPATLPPPAATLRAELVFSELVTLAPDITPGRTPRGGRNIVPITGGTFEGPGDGHGIRGTIIPGGWDWQLRRPDGCLEIKADYFLKTDDGVVINIVNAGAVCAPVAGQPFAPRTTPVFEAPVGKYEWLNKGAFTGTLEPTKGPDGKPAVRIGVYRVR